ncbi:amidohydrolase family protein [bacterium]|nr:amidohydrolase family protein [bacterium]
MAQNKADLVLHNGRVFGHPECDSVAVGAGRIMAYGGFNELKSLVGPSTHLIRLNGRTVAPGFVDCHLHFMEGAAATTGANVQRCRTLGDLFAALRLAAGRTPPGNWLRAFGCDEALIAERRGPTRAELDQTAPRNPVRLRHQTLHASWLNSRAIAALGLESPDFHPPDGAWLDRDSDGRLTGFVAGLEQWLSDRLPLVTAAELESRARNFSRELAAGGITAFTDATVRNGPNQIAALARMASAGVIRQRAGVMLGENFIDAASEARRIADASGLRLAGVKFMDVARARPERLARDLGRALSLGLDAAFHATELDEINAALTAIHRVRKEMNPRLAAGTVCRVEHGGVIPPDYPEAIARMGVWVVTNPGFLHYRAAKYAADPGLTAYRYRARSLLDAGVELAAGTDAPVTPPRPLTAIAAAVTRRGAEGEELAPAEALPVATAFELFTSRAARLSRLAAGAIEPGYLADLIVLGADPLAAAPAELANLPIELTIIGGKVVYERGRPAIAQSDTANLYSP